MQGPASAHSVHGTQAQLDEDESEKGGGPRGYRVHGTQAQLDEEDSEKGGA